ncbi:unnamed protein product [Staurois parvus]|uniref:Transposase n=1 Tax=Staurois parvus TaxID=386267 RepID=A0ABN9B1G8_9NEOB|nr:unnamed protein product [Staurois parvus]
MWHSHKALMSTDTMDADRWHFWGYTDHQGTLIITLSVTAREERNADNLIGHS